MENTPNSQTKVNEVMDAYRECNNTLAASIPNAIRDIGNPSSGSTADAQKYILASMSHAVDQVGKSLSIALKDVSEGKSTDFPENCKQFVSKLGEKTQSFKRLLSK